LFIMGRDMSCQEIEALKHQLLQWEREKRLAMRVGGVLIVLCLALAGHAALGSRQSRQVLTEQLLLKDRDGLVRVRLMLDETDNPRFQFFDGLGREQFALSAMPDTSVTMTFSDHGARRAILATPSEGLARLMFPPQPGQPDGAPAGLLADEPGQPAGDHAQPASWIRAFDTAPPRILPDRPATGQRWPRGFPGPALHDEGSPV
jgi:hypothetical protein